LLSGRSDIQEESQSDAGGQKRERQVELERDAEDPGRHVRGHTDARREPPDQHRYRADARHPRRHLVQLAFVEVDAVADLAN
jgi:hypothetical protein